VVTFLTNPLMFRALLLLLAAGGAFMFAISLMRRLRQSIAAEADLDSPAPTLEGMPVHLYNTVIQQLKQQKHELQVKTVSEQHRARTTENFSQTVLSNLSSGVLVFDLNGLVKQSNPAAKEILGFRSLSGMSAEDVFRDAALGSRDSSAVYSDWLSNFPVRLAEEIHAALNEGSKRRQLEADYTTPGGEQLHLAVTVSAVPAVDGSLLAVACLISDRSEIERIRRQQQLNSEISAEMALELRTSLTSIAGYAQQLAQNRDPDLAQQLAADIAAEATSLDRRIGGFLVEKTDIADPSPSARAASQGI
jgi:nitrogen fixation/metabolism regulation signal transduction histidine kinase